MRMPLSVSCRADDGDKHSLDVNQLVYYKGKLYSASDDGKIKSWSEDLTKLAEVQADPCSVYGLTAGDDTLYSCSNDGTVKAWTLDTLELKGIITEQKDTEFWKIYFADGKLYVGDNDGNVNVYIKNQFYGKVNVAEPVKDLIVTDHILFTTKDTDLTITELKYCVTNEDLQFGTLRSYMGRAPIALVGKRYIAFAARDAKEIMIHEDNVQNHFPEVTKISNAHEMVINSIAGAVWDNQHLIFSGGWDKLLKKWSVDKNLTTPEGSLNVDFVINTIAPAEPGMLYVGGADGHIVRVDASS